MRRFEELLERTDRIERQAHAAVAGFRVPRNGVRTRKDLRQILARFQRHLENAQRTGRRRPAPRSLSGCYARAYERMKRHYGERPEETALEIARRGVEGGLYGILRTLAEDFVRREGADEVQRRVDGFWRHRPRSQQELAIARYWRRYRDVLPREIGSPRDWRLRANFPAVLRRHPRMLLGFRILGRNYPRLD